MCLPATKTPYVSRLIQLSGDVELNPGPDTRQSTLTRTGELRPPASNVDEPVMSALREIHIKVPHFPEFNSKVKDTIEELGGNVFPKLNWSSPRDATWIAFNGSLKCSCPNDVYLLLKSSDYVTHDLTKPFSGCADDGQDSIEVQYELVLRKWRNVIEGMEFRVFVRNRNIIGISQRHYTNHYPHIDKMKVEIQQEIEDFFKEHIQQTFPDDNFIMDVYRRKEECILVIDFNPFGESTDPLLYSWEELHASNDVPVAVPLAEDGDACLGIAQCGLLRYVKSSLGILPNPMHMHRMPQDFLDLRSGADVNKLVDFLQMERQSQDKNSGNKNK
ncbi:translation initiation factor eIF2 assembly protein-like isoform X1 [Ptychodera flava]|uniref:translation initiation factor eIF2 assembly protein-like isoform X1 n=1 Tax=Ptychodera flava TaxID=63121 RepID=UPI00396AB08B